MRRIFFIGTLLSALLLVSACTSMVPYSEHSEFPADGTKYEILGRVTVNTAIDKSGYSKLIAEAAKKYPGADDVVNIVVDDKETRFLFYHRHSYTMSGIAIRYR